MKNYKKTLYSLLILVIFVGAIFAILKMRPSYDISFFKEQLVEMPDSVIEQCNLSEGVFFVFSPDRIIEATIPYQDGRVGNVLSGVTGAIPSVYDKSGNEVASCYHNLDSLSAKYCEEIYEVGACKYVYVSEMKSLYTKQYGREGIEPVDVYNLAE